MVFFLLKFLIFHFGNKKARYDKIVNAKLQAKLRAKQGDAKRQKLINDLEYREAAARRGSPVNEEQRFKVQKKRKETI